MAYSSSGSSSSKSSDTEVTTCTQECLKSYNTLKEHYDKLVNDYRKSQLVVASYQYALESVEERVEVYKKNETFYDGSLKSLNIDVKLRDNVAEKTKSGEGYHVVPPPLTGNFMPPKPELVLDESNVSATCVLIVEPKVETRKENPVRTENSPAIIEDWESNNEEENEPKPKVVRKACESKTEEKENVSKNARPNNAKIEFVKPKSTRKASQDTKAKGNQRN
ncbi:hypothetical protein Tco_0499307 [Tanacetum coccineum]